MISDWEEGIAYVHLLLAPIHTAQLHSYVTQIYISDLLHSYSAGACLYSAHQLWFLCACPFPSAMRNDRVCTVVDSTMQCMVASLASPASVRQYKRQLSSNQMDMDPLWLWSGHTPVPRVIDGCKQARQSAWRDNDDAYTLEPDHSADACTRTRRGRPWMMDPILSASARAGSDYILLVFAAAKSAELDYTSC
jgi:hypothetical protein